MSPAFEPLLRASLRLQFHKGFTLVLTMETTVNAVAVA